MTALERLKQYDTHELRRMLIQAKHTQTSEGFAAAIANEVYSSHGVMLAKDRFAQIAAAVIQDIEAEIASREHANDPGTQSNAT